MDCLIPALVALVVLGPGVLAPADTLVLERVEVNRVWHGWGLDEFASPDTVRIAVDDCGLLGYHGLILVDDAVYPAYVVDCTNAQHATLASRGIVADISVKELGHREATVLLWTHE